MVTIERQFLHDIATPLSIAKLTIKKTISDLESGNFEKEKHLERLKKIEKAINALEELHASHKKNITT